MLIQSVVKKLSKLEISKSNKSNESTINLKIDKDLLLVSINNINELFKENKESMNTNNILVEKESKD